MRTAGNKLTIFSWAMYDFANTIFAMNIITLYFTLWVTIDMKGQDIYYSIALSVSMLITALTAPILGSISDRWGKKIPFLICFTIICCLFTALIGIANHLLLGLVLFVIANYCYQIAYVFYNALLPTVADPQHIGRVSGYGTGLGYVGTIAGLALAAPFALHYGRQATFIPTAICFLIFALPCFIFVKDKKTTTTTKKSTKQLIREITKHPTLLRFLIGIFIAFNAINTIYIFMAVYTKKVIGFGSKEIIALYITSSIFAIAGSFIAGFFCDRIGAKKTFVGTVLLWVVSIILAIVSFHKSTFWFVGPLIGICLAGTWTSARAVTVDLSPPEMIGEIFGFYSLVGRTASIIGPLIWGLTVLGLNFMGNIKYRCALAVLLIFLIISLWVIRKVPNKVTQ